MTRYNLTQHRGYLHLVHFPHPQRQFAPRPANLPAWTRLVSTVTFQENFLGPFKGLFIFSLPFRCEDIGF